MATRLLILKEEDILAGASIDRSTARHAGRIKND